MRAQRGVSINRENGVLMGGGCDSGPPQRSSEGVYYMPNWNTGDAKRRGRTTRDHGQSGWWRVRVKETPTINFFLFPQHFHPSTTIRFVFRAKALFEEGIMHESSNRDSRMTSGVKN